jgi:putative Mn2+ efflux pump MntP
MSQIELIILSAGLAMDATAVLFCLSLVNPKTKSLVLLKAATIFALFQGAMPFFGYFVGLNFKNSIQNFDHWIAFLLLIAVGGKMILEAKNENKCTLFSNKNLLLMGIATSIDALVVGVTFSLVEINLYYAMINIAVVTLLLSMTAAVAAKRISSINPKYLHLLGGIAIILIGVKILIEHLIN